MYLSLNSDVDTTIQWKHAMYWLLC